MSDYDYIQIINNNAQIKTLCLQLYEMKTFIWKNFFSEEITAAAVIWKRLD